MKSRDMFSLSFTYGEHCNKDSTSRLLKVPVAIFRVQRAYQKLKSLEEVLLRQCCIIPEFLDLAHHCLQSCFGIVMKLVPSF